MSTFLVILPVAALAAIFAFSIRQKSKGVPAKKIISSNLLAFILVAAVLGTLTFTVSAKETEQADTAAVTETAEVEAETETKADNSKSMGLLAAALVTSVSGIAGGIAVAAGAPAAIAATTEDPKSFGKSLIFVALGESIALYGVIISILILNKV